MNKISAYIIVRNEEDVIGKCLKSIINVVDEIIVAHDGECQDRTIEICKKYNVRIFIRERQENFNSHRVFCLKQAKYPWILRIDADEFLSEELKNKIRDLINVEEIDAYDFSMPIWDGKEQLTKKWPYIRCLFKKDKISFLGILHYVPDVKGIVKKGDFIIGHCPKYNNFTFNIFKSKWLPKAKVHAKIYLSDFSEIEKFNYKGKDWPLKIRLRVKFPLLLIPAEFSITFLKNLLSGGYKEGLIAYKYSLIVSSYRAMVNYYIFKYKHLKNKV